MTVPAKEFGLYGQYYDLLYRDKDYVGETDYVEKLLKIFAPSGDRILEFGCGTGRHAELLAYRGYKVTGVERSAAMVQQAEVRAKSVASDSQVSGSFHAFLAEAKNFRCDVKFDAVISLFHVVSYQTARKELLTFFENVERHLNEQGTFIFDVWYGPAVLAQRPEVRIKTMSDENIDILRLANPTLDVSQSTVQVDYTVFAKSKSDEFYRRFDESHLMRYLFDTEIDELAERFAMKLVRREEWMTGKPLSDSTWGACYVLRKICESET